ncbi:MAG TPA: GxxExxY protein [Chitinophagaceae bacterium]|jgi:GxxExxY protein|nr:GxxExxY protein [Chitinophagaceae bacterium]
MSELVYKEESYSIIGLCMEVHNQLGHGFSEIVYKDALEFEFSENGIVYEREKEYPVFYKGNLLKHKFYADFVVFDKIILEVKCVKSIADEHESQAINYLKVSDNRLALLVNFARGKMEYKRIIY